MTTEQKLRLLEIGLRISSLNKELFELSSELEEADLPIILKSTEKLLEASSCINKAISN